MRQLFSYVIAPALFLVAASAAAWAGPFGGFSADETRYLVDRDTVCSPIDANAAGGAAPACATADAAAVAGLKFRRGALQSGRNARFEASARGRDLTVRSLGPSAADLATFTSTDPIARVVAVYASPNGRMVAIEYEVRFGGRLRVEVVAFAAATGTGPTPGPSAEPAGDPAPVLDPVAKPDSGPSDDAPVLGKEAQRALDKAAKLAAKKRHADAARSYAAVLAEDADHAEARFGLARALAGQGKGDDAVRELEVLARSARADAARWRVEARFDDAFVKLRGDARFRKAVGLDRAPGATVGLYERLVGFSSTWEQPEVTCEAPEVGLSLDRLKKTFRLHILTRCGGYTDKVSLKGSWRLEGADRVILVLPNKKTQDEAVMCAMDTCDGEDCLRCAVDVDLEFTLRPVRR